MGTETFGALTSEQYVRLTTFKRDGTPVPTPVWIVPTGPELWVITTTSTGKAKRIRHTSRVLLTPCDMRGRVEPGSPEVEARATLDQDPETLRTLRRGIMRRYWLLGPPFMAVQAVLKRLGRMEGDQVAVRLTAA